MPEPTSQLFRTVRIARASGDIVSQIKASIFEGKLGPGDRLPAERELTEQFGVSRITVRDAMRVLESQGLVEIKVGAGGGAFIAAPSAEPITQVLTDMLRLQGISIRELVEARLVIETAIVTLAAERATPDDLRAMQEAIAEARAARAAGNQRFTPHSINFHIALAQAAKNQVLFFTVNSFRTPFYETLDKLAPDDSMGQRAIEDHQKLLDAITVHDAKRAREVMREHLAY
ncbi:MAG: FadR family transcriptional regulator, partial [Chloroflexi bacterium]|nr:FadR family transcriptional regulator [Chloroflexota bacterium]